MFSDHSSDLIRDIEAMIRTNYDGGMIKMVGDAMNASAPPETATATDPAAATEQTLKNLLVETQATEEYIHWNAPKTATQMYSALESAAEEINPPLQEVEQDDQSPESMIAIEMLLANSGNLFNGAVGGLENAFESASPQTTRRRRQSDRKHARVASIMDIDTDLASSEHDFEDDSDFENEMRQNALPVKYEQDESYRVYENLGSFNPPSRGFVS